MTRAEVTPSRTCALNLLEQVDRGHRLDLAWELVASSLEQQDRRWVHEAVFGAIRLRGRLDHLLDTHLHRGLSSVPIPLLRALRLGAYQILYMQSVPTYAAVSQATTQASAIGGSKGAGLVNAVLRAVADGGADSARFPGFAEDPVGYLSSWGSHPSWLVERWLRRFGATKARTIVDSGNRVPELYLRPVGVEVALAAQTLRTEGVEVSDGPKGARTLKLPPQVNPAVVLQAVPGIIQDPAAAATTDFVRVSEGERVADLCAAPGGKGVALIDSGAWLVGLDRSLERLERMQESLRRLGLSERLVVARGEAPPLRDVDTVLVDAPCTGTGTLARHPDARWRLKPESPAKMASVQFQILAGAATIVRPGGLLIYSTCTLEVEENEGVVESFLGTHPDFALDEGEAFLNLLPGMRSSDGAFAARMRREE